MELNKEENARFLVHHQVTEKKLLHLEKGVRKLGFQSGGNRILAGLLAASGIGLAIGLIFDGMVARTFSAIAVVLLLVFAVGVYSIFKAWFDAKKTIHLQYEDGKKDMNYGWEYRFYDDCYEAIGKNEVSRVSYSNLGRILEFTGMLVLVEKGNVVRYFMEADVEKGTAEELKTFLERKSGTKIEFVSVR